LGGGGGLSWRTFLDLPARVSQRKARRFDLADGCDMPILRLFAASEYEESLPFFFRFLRVFLLI
jgi:hypothetical protein